ncbi:MAG: hypothetical protein QOF10_462 [Kribbellaceae bacterium]|jgi:hypothetical protein|nr:hypothetical protein [Kribbellaceae bacterium]
MLVRMRSDCASGFGHATAHWLIPRLASHRPASVRIATTRPERRGPPRLAGLPTTLRDLPRHLCAGRTPARRTGHQGPPYLPHPGDRQARPDPAFSGASRSWPTSPPAAPTTAGPKPPTASSRTRRLGHGFRNFTNYRLRNLLAVDGTRPYDEHPPMRNSEEPLNMIRVSDYFKRQLSTEVVGQILMCFRA